MDRAAAERAVAELRRSRREDRFYCPVRRSGEKKVWYWRNYGRTMEGGKTYYEVYGDSPLSHLDEYYMVPLLMRLGPDPMGIFSASSLPKGEGKTITFRRHRG